MGVFDLPSQLEGLKNAIASSTQAVQGSLDFIKEFLQNLTIFGMDTFIIIAYILYIAMIVLIGQWIYKGFLAYKKNTKIFRRLLFLGKRTGEYLEKKSRYNEEG